jgi:hypothetical protein
VQPGGGMRQCAAYIFITSPRIAAWLLVRL